MSTVPTTQRVVNNHLQAFGQGDLDAIMDDFADDAAFHTSDAVYRGYDEIRELFSELLAKFPPGSDIQINQRRIDGELAFLVWSGKSENVEVSFAVDTIIIRNGKIVKQTFAAQMSPA